MAMERNLKGRACRGIFWKRGRKGRRCTYRHSGAFPLADRWPGGEPENIHLQRNRNETACQFQKLNPGSKTAGLQLLRNRPIPGFRLHGEGRLYFR